jgi:hypothetical protein
MRNYLRKRNRVATTGAAEALPGANFKQPSQYRNKFKLDTWTHSAKTRALNARRLLDQKKEIAKGSISDFEDSESAVLSSPVTQFHEWQPRQNFNFILDSRHLDPFNSLSVGLGPRSERLLLHCKLSISLLWLRC